MAALNCEKSDFNLYGFMNAASITTVFLFSFSIPVDKHSLGWLGIWCVATHDKVPTSAHPDAAGAAYWRGFAGHLCTTGSTSKCCCVYLYSFITLKVSGEKVFFRNDELKAFVEKYSPSILHLEIGSGVFPLREDEAQGI